MKKILFVTLFILAINAISAQCYQPNVAKGNAALSNGKFTEAYDFYSKATKCPDASRFNNGQEAKEGIKKCLPILTIDGQKEIEITVGPESGSKTFYIKKARLSYWWVSTSTSWISFPTGNNYDSDSFKIEWEENKSQSDRQKYIYIYGSGYAGDNQPSVKLVVNQKHRERSLFVGDNATGTTLDVPSYAGNHTVKITSNGNWTCKVNSYKDTSWISFEKQSNQTLGIKVKKNSGAKRTANLTVTSGIETVSITINQQSDPSFKEEDWKDKAYMDIKDIVFTNNFDDNFTGNTLNNKLYANQITYLGIWLKYDGKIDKRIDSIYVKIFDNGKLSRGTKSPSGYTFMTSFYVENGENKNRYLQGWGNDNASFFTKGTYKCEIWYKNKMLFSKELKLEKDNDLLIYGVDFAGVDALGNIATSFSRSFKAEDYKYLKPRLSFHNTGSKLVNKHYNIKLIDPDGNEISKYSVLFDNTEKKYDSVLYNDYIPLIDTGKSKHAELHPISTKIFANKPGKWTIRLFCGTESKIFESHFFIYDNEHNVTINGSSDLVMPLPSYSGCQLIKIQSTSSIKSYALTFVHQEIYKTKYNPIFVYTHSPQKNALDLSEVNGLQRDPGIRVEMMTDSSFLIRWLCAENIQYGKNAPRYNVTLSNEIGTASLQLTTPIDSVNAAINNTKKITPKSISLRNSSVKMDLIYVRGGTSALGGTSETNSDIPIHIEKTKDFYMSELAVTQELWLAVMGKEPAAGWNRKQGKGKDMAAYNITFEEAKRFISKLNSMTGENYSLPTENEFEYTFRGGSVAQSWGYNLNAGVHTYKQTGELYEWTSNGKLKLYTKPWFTYGQRDNDKGIFHIVYHPK